MDTPETSGPDLTPVEKAVAGLVAREFVAWNPVAMLTHADGTVAGVLADGTVWLFTGLEAALRKLGHPAQPIQVTTPNPAG